MKLEKGQTWVSNEYPHESFKIYDIIEQEWDHHSKEIFFCWERTNIDEFNRFIANKKGMSVNEFMESDKTTYPYAWCSESKKSTLISKIKKFDMKLTSPTVTERCNACDGSGKLGFQLESCWYCGGTGEINKENNIKLNEKE